MKPLIYLFLCLFTFTASAQTLSVAQLKADYDYLRHALEEAHGGLYRHHSKTEIDKLFDQYRQKLKEPMVSLNYYGLLSKLLANIGDGHMKLEYAGTPPNPYFFPFRILIEGDEATILSNDTKNNNTIKPGMKLLAINNQSFKETKKLILPFLLSDGVNETKKISSLERNFSQLYKIFVDTSSFFSVKVSDSSGKVFSAKVQGIRNEERDLNRNQNPVNANTIALTKRLEGSPANAFLSFTNDNIALLRIRYFVGDRFKQELDSLFGLISIQNSKTLILDLRGNGGGLDEYGAYTATKLVNEPFRYIDKVHARILVPSDADWKAKPPVDLMNGTVPDPNGGYQLKRLLNTAIGLQEPSLHPYTGKLIVLIDGRTFSAASDFSAIIGNKREVVFIGVETGGGYQGNTSGLNEIVKLPNSKFKVNIHLWDYWSSVKPPKQKSRGVMPTFKVERKVSDWLKGIDNQLEFALKFCRKD